MPNSVYLIRGLNSNFTKFPDPIPIRSGDEMVSVIMARLRSDTTAPGTVISQFQSWLVSGVSASVDLFNCGGGTPGLFGWCPIGSKLIPCYQSGWGQYSSS
eukprot:TRINITY_DN8832_c0_g1_i4.p1 TRINITY_DN8832_c0_g1~~TRINITY_DN8832_c0_g1_i4.p1  ORF type:complete len:101 (+),score=5.06 TRINITY_DN8832_c0_g1_i4:466-768(+)